MNASCRAFRLKAKQKPSAPLTQSDLNVIMGDRSGLSVAQLASSLHFPMGEPADLIRCLVMQGLAPLYQRAIAASPSGEPPRFEWLSGVWMGGQRGYMLLIEGKAVAWLGFEAAGSLAPGAPEPMPESTVPVRRAVLGIQFVEWPQAPIGMHHTPT